jgi:hypothetical protein
MAKESGLGFSVAVDDSAASAQTILTLADMSVKLSGVFNDAANMSHAVFKTVPSTSVVRTCTLGISGQTLAGELIFSKYDLKRSNKGEFTWEVQGDLANGAVPTWS